MLGADVKSKMASIAVWIDDLILLLATRFSFAKFFTVEKVVSPEVELHVVASVPSSVPLMQRSVEVVTFEVPA